MREEEGPNSNLPTIPGVWVAAPVRLPDGAAFGSMVLMSVDIGGAR